MKTIFIFILMMICVLPGLAGDVDSVITDKQYYQDTLTATIDTIDVSFQNDVRGLNYFTVYCYTTTGDDTLTVSTTAADGTSLSQKGIEDLSDASNDAQIVISTTPKEFLIDDPNPAIIRLMTSDASASTVIIVGGKRVEN